MENIQKVIDDPKSVWKHQLPENNYRIDGKIDGTKIRVIVDPRGEGIITAFPQ